MYIYIYPFLSQSREGFYRYDQFTAFSTEYRRQAKAWNLKLAFWCLNPAVVFENTASLARCILLTSGTLSPMDTFASELGTEFPIRVEAMHIIDKHQVCVMRASQKKIIPQDDILFF